MFAFIKKLLNFQMKDTNPVKGSQQVGSETNNTHNKFQHVKIKDTDWKQKPSIDQNYQRNKSSKKYFSSCNSFAVSNVTASRSSDKRKCSILAARNIKKIVNEFLLPDKGDKIINEVETKITNPNKLQQKTIRFCHKCRNLKTFYDHASKREYCDKCGSILLYLCCMCGAKHYASLKGLREHEKVCDRDRKYTNKKLMDVDNKSVFHQCPDCHLRIFDEQSMRFQLIKTEIEDNIDEINTKGRTGKANEKKRMTANKQMESKNFARWTRRYCNKCQKTMKLGVSKRSYQKNKNKCQSCSTILQFLCVKCHAKYNSNADLIRHFKSKCFSVNYKCTQCKFCSASKQAMSLHLKVKHKCQTQFKCDMCTFETKFKSNLKRHVEGHSYA